MSDEGLILEAFTNPASGVFMRKFNITKFVTDFTFNYRVNDLRNGKFDIDENFPFLSEIHTVDPLNHANDAGSVIRVKRGLTPILHFVTINRRDTIDDGHPTAEVLLAGMEYFRDKTPVPRYDHPRQPSTDPDWIYGAETVLKPITGGATNEIQQYWTLATTGAFTMDFAGQTTVSVTMTTDRATVTNDMRAALDTLTNLIDWNFEGLGYEFSPWILTIIDPAGDQPQLTFPTSTLNGSIFPGTITNGGGLSPLPWIASFNPVTGLQHGTVQSAMIITTDAPPGDTYCLYLDLGPPPWPGDYGGYQQYANIGGGRRHLAGVWVKSIGAAQVIRLVIRDMFEGFIASNNDVTIFADVWTYLSIPFFDTNISVDNVIYRVAVIDEGDPAPILIGIQSALLAPGFPPATYGQILLEILAAAQLQGYLTWLVPTFTALVDSDGVVWDQLLHWGIKHAQSIYQLEEYARRWGYEEKPGFNTTTGFFEWNVYNPDGDGIDLTGTGVAVVVKEGPGGGNLEHRIPDATAFDAEGSQWEWGQYENTILSGVWGKLGRVHINAQGLASDNLTVLAQRLTENAAAREDAFSTTIRDGHSLPWRDWNPADRLMVNTAPHKTKHVMRNVAVTVSQSRGMSVPDYDTHWDSIVYTDESALVQTVSDLTRKFDYLDFETEEPPMPTGGKGGEPTVVVAAFNASAQSKAKADFICTGIDDKNFLKAADAVCAAVGGGRIGLTEGTFSCVNALLTFSTDVVVYGRGKNVTIIELGTTGTITLGTRSWLKHMTVKRPTPA